LLSEIDPKASAGTVTYPPGGTLGPRTQSDVQLVLVHTGSAHVWVDDAAHTISAGEVGLLLPGHSERFAFDVRVTTRHSWVQVNTAQVPARFASLPAVLPLSPALDTIVREAVATVALPKVVAHLAAAALWRYAGEAERGSPERARPVDDAQRFIHAHLHETDLTLGDIAGAAHVTPAHLIRSFRAAHGITPMAYLWQRRVALAVDLLAGTGLPLATVAERCGFKTVHHFSRRVRNAGGLPPAALRRDRWG